jgi:hypothetical protein
MGWFHVLDGVRGPQQGAVFSGVMGRAQRGKNLATNTQMDLLGLQHCARASFQ